MSDQSTAIVRVNPQLDIEVQNFYEEALKLHSYADQRVIATTEDLKPATDDLSIIAKVKKALEAKRKDYVQPIQEHVKSINDTFKTLTQPIDEADRITRKKILEYQQEQDRKHREAEEINREKYELAQREAALNETGEITVDTTQIEVVPEAPKRLYTDMGMVGQRMIRKWEVVDFSQVPDEYKAIDAGKVTKLVKAGIGGIPGIRIFEEPTLAVNPK